MFYNKTMIEFSKMTKYHHSYMAINFLDGMLLTNRIAVFGDEKSGKSSLLRLIAGVDKTTEGKVLISGVEASINEDTYFSFRDGGLLKNKTLEQNFLYPLELRKVENRQEIVNNLLKEFDLENQKNQKPSRLTIEERARAIIAKIKLRKASLVLIDNPLAYLSTDVRKEYFAMFLDVIKDFDGVVVYATDDKDEILAFSEVVLLNYGVVKGVGNLDLITNNPSNLFAYSLYCEPKLYSGKLVKEQGKSVFVCKEGNFDVSKFDGRIQPAFYCGDCLLAVRDVENVFNFNTDFWLFDWMENSIVD